MCWATDITMSTITLQKIVNNALAIGGKFMTVKKKTRLTSYNFWVRIVSAVVLILRIVLSKFGINIDSAFMLDIATLVAGFLVVVGIINEPTGITISYKNELGDDMANNENIKTKIDEKLKEVEKIFAGFGIKDKTVVAESLQKIDDFLVTILQNELKDLEKMQNELDSDENKNADNETTETEGADNETAGAEAENMETEETDEQNTNVETAEAEAENIEVEETDEQNELQSTETAINEPEEPTTAEAENMETEETDEQNTNVETAETKGADNETAEVKVLTAKTEGADDETAEAKVLTAKNEITNGNVKTNEQIANIKTENLELQTIVVQSATEPDETIIPLNNNNGAVINQSTKSSEIAETKTEHPATQGENLFYNDGHGNVQTTQSAVEIIGNLQDEFCGDDQTKRADFCNRLLHILEDNLDSLV